MFFICHAPAEVMNGRPIVPSGRTHDTSHFLFWVLPDPFSRLAVTKEERSKKTLPGSSAGSKNREHAEDPGRAFFTLHGLSRPNVSGELFTPKIENVGRHVL